MTEKKSDSPLRKGWTTGSCATAACVAAYRALTSGDFPDPVQITLPGGQTPSFVLNAHGQDGEGVWASVIKDAGDDPDVTHGAEIIVSLKPLKAGTGIVFKAGAGVGTVTKPGLPLDVGEPAINPVPRQMIRDHLGQGVDVEVTVSIKEGEKLAAQTMNPRLGIIGGLSVLGTTGVVVPYSCAAWIHSIHRGVDVAKATGLSHIAACTGSTSEKTVVEKYGLEEGALIDMGDFSGGFLKYLRKVPIEKVTICGGFAKLCKLANGDMDLHSSKSRIDFDQLSQWVGDLGGSESLVQRVRGANTALEVLTLSQEDNIELGHFVALRAREAARAIVSGNCAIEVIAINRTGEIVGYAET